MSSEIIFTVKCYIYLFTGHRYNLEYKLNYNMNSNEYKRKQCHSVTQTILIL